MNLSQKITGDHGEARNIFEDQLNGIKTFNL